MGTGMIALCEKKYDKKTFDHVLRVEKYALENPVIEYHEKEVISAIALGHDLLEDTDCTEENIKVAIKCDHLFINDDLIIDAIKLLTHDKKNMSYNDYIQKIKDDKSYAGRLAYIIKLADMKDHLIETDTLTDKLKEKYYAALPILL